MKKTFFALSLAAALLAGGTTLFAEDKPVSINDIKLDANTYKVMSLNLRYANEFDKYPWSKRQVALRKFLKEQKPDVFGTQEGLYNQIRDIVGDDDSSEYKWIGMGRDGGSKGEHMAIFYKKDRFIPLEYDHVWLSENPRQIGLKSWDAACPRLVTWVRFLDKESNRQFYFCNTHLDHVSDLARVNGCKVVCNEIAKFKKDLPVFVTGDFNTSSANEKVHKVFIDAGLIDTWDDKDQLRVNEEYNTYNGYRPVESQKKKDHIDWIFTRPNADVLATEIYLYPEGTDYISDHFPVISIVKLPEVK